MKRMLAAAMFLLFLVPARADTMLDAPAYNWTYGCVPTAAAMLMGYWDAHGFPNLLAAQNSLLTADVLPELGELASLMGTTNGWTYLYRLAPALTMFASEHGYSFNAYSTGFLPWEQVTARLDAGEPLLAWVDTGGNGRTTHSVPVIGYQGTDYCYYTTWTEEETAVCSPYKPMSLGQTWGVGYLSLLEPIRLETSGGIGVAGSAAVGVPEPRSLLLLLAGLPWIVRRRPSAG